MQGFLQTGQVNCYGVDGRPLSCAASGQDGQYGSGLPWPVPRFETGEETVLDRLSGLVWTADANPAEFPLTWSEALDFVRSMNERADHGFSDWRLPNRRELRSLVSYQTRRPALPEDHPFANVFLNWYWTSTTAAINPAYAWYVHMDGARMFYGRKDQYSLVWPVRGESTILPATGQQACYDAQGGVVQCSDQVEDGGGLTGVPWPDPRFAVKGEIVLDRLTGLCWLRRASLSEDPVNWQEALDLVAGLNRTGSPGAGKWRLPNINELESLVDSASHSPALLAEHPFDEVQEIYWSSTTSFYEPDWAWALYLVKGALGVGVKANRTFHVWPVCDG